MTLFSQCLNCLFGKSDVNIRILSLFSYITGAELISIGACSSPNLIMYFWQSLIPKHLDISIVFCHGPLTMVRAMSCACCVWCLRLSGRAEGPSDRSRIPCALFICSNRSFFSQQLYSGQTFKNSLSSWGWSKSLSCRCWFHIPESP